jgi:hypothetical protein
MSNRWLRFGIALLAIGAAGAAGYRIFQQNQRLFTDVAATRVADDAAESALVSISELKAAMHAYVAEGQGDAFWIARATSLLDRVRASILELEAPAAAAGVPLTETLDLVDRVAAAEQRARRHVNEGQRLMAGDVIFTESRDLLDAMRLQIVAARAAVLKTTTATEANVQREQTLLTIGALGILAFATLLLVIPGASAQSPTSSPSPEAEAVSSARLVAPPTPASKSSGVRTAVATPESSPSERTVTPAPTLTPAISLREAAAVCTELGRVSQSIEISTLLERAAKVLNASGVVVWMASPDRHEMYPAASAGYDERLLARIGSIKRDANNVTAGALRDASPRTSSKAGSSAAALAVPLMTPLGPVGVFSAEIRELEAVDETRLAVATIFAAQLATLLGSMSAPSMPESADAESAAVKAQA